MIPRGRGKVDEYIWEKEMQRLDRYKDRPWELQNSSQLRSSFIATLVALICVVGIFALVSLF